MIIMLDLQTRTPKIFIPSRRPSCTEYIYLYQSILTSADTWPVCRWPSLWYSLRTQCNRSLLSATIPRCHWWWSWWSWRQWWLWFDKTLQQTFSRSTAGSSWATEFSTFASSQTSTASPTCQKIGAQFCLSCFNISKIPSRFFWMNHPPSE